jgi:hypothetical protein
MLLLVAIWLGVLALGIVAMQLTFLVGRDTQRRHLGACDEAATGAER